MSTSPHLTALVMALLLAAGCGKAEPQPGLDLPATVRVAPFEVAGQAEDAGYVGEAFAGSVAVTLSIAAGLEIVTAAEPTAPTHRLTGVLTREGSSVRVEAQLHDASSAAAVWQTRLDSEAGDLGGLANELARAAAGPLRGSFPKLYEYLGDVRGGAEVEGSPLRRRAQQAFRRYDIESFLRESSALVEAHGDDPAAHALEAAALSLLLNTAPTAETMARLKTRLDELRRVDPSSPYDLLFRAYVSRSSGEPSRAQILYTRVLSRSDLSPRARSWTLRQRSYAHLQVGNKTAAREDAEAAVRLDPAEAAGLFALSRALEATGRLDEAILRANQALALEPSSWRNRQRLGLVLTRAGRFEEAVASLERSCELSSVQEACANLAVALQRAGRAEAALTAAQHADSLSGSSWGLYNLACYHALAGRESDALDALSRSIEHGFTDVLITSDPDLDSLRGDSRFHTLVTAVEDRIRARRNLLESTFPWQS